MPIFVKRKLKVIDIKNLNLSKSMKIYKKIAFVKIAFVLVALCFAIQTQAQDILANGLKAALEQGITKGVNSASATDGFLKNPLIRIPFPPEIKFAEEKLRAVGLGSQVDKFVTSMNRGAESAAKSALPIFLKAITNMSITDALSLLKGDANAATNFLRNSTYETLVTTFRPTMQTALGNSQATSLYGQLMGRYNQLPFVQKANPDLNDYATRKAVDGLFILVAQEEKNIRENPAARATDLLKSVFGGK
jgi:hypothetical protein